VEVSARTAPGDTGQRFVGSRRSLQLVVTALRRPPSLVFVAGRAAVGKTTLVNAAVAALPTEVARVGCLPGGQHPAWPSSPTGVLVLEDVQWLDEPGRRQLRALIARLPRRASLVVTYRPDELPVAGLPLGAECRPPMTTHVLGISLEPLDRAGVAEALHAFGVVTRDVAPADELVRQLHAQSGGIPALLAALLEGSHGPGARMEIPPLAAQWIAGRTARLSPDERRLLSAAAVLDRPSTEPQLAALAHLSPGRALVALCVLLESGLLREQAPGRYVVVAGLIQQWLYRQVPPPLRQRLHAAAIPAIRGEDPVDRAALFEHCRRAGDLKAAVAHAEVAADAAAAAGDTVWAIQLLQAALAESAVGPSTRARLAVRLARIAGVGRRSEDTIVVLRGILDDGRLPTAVRGEIRFGLGLLLMNQAGEVDAGRAEIARSVGDLLQRRPALAARAMAALAMPQWGRCHADEHRSWLERAEQAATLGRDPALATAVFANRLALHMNLGDPSVWSELEQLASQQGSVAQRQQVGRAYANLVDAAACQGHYRLVDQFSREARRLAAQTGAGYVDALVRAAELRMLWATGRWADLAERAQWLLTDSAQLPLVAADARLALAQLALTRAEWEEAVNLLDVPELLDPDNGCAPELSAASTVRVRAWAAGGDHARAAEEARQSLRRERAKGVWGWSGELVRAAVDVLLAVGALSEAGAATEDLAEGIADRDAPLAAAMLLSCRAALLEAAGDRRGAIGLYEQARAAFQGLPRPYDAVREREAVSRCLLACGDRGDDVLTQVAAGYAALGATHDAARCQHLLRRLGAVTPRPPGRRSYGSELSPREHDVARLMRLGRTNREIAELLFLSTRTVEAHAARVLHKLGLADRAHMTGRPTVSDRTVSEPQ